MSYKRLRSVKKIESDLAAKLSLSVKKQLSEAVMNQFVETMKIPAEFSEATDGINTMGYLILRVGHNLNDYFEAVSGSGKYINEKTEICGLLSDICIKSEEYIGRKNLGLICRMPKENIVVDIDREKFCYAILNLILNAAENTPSGGRIRVGISKTKNFVKIIVGDNGFGMDEESINHCFEPFYTKNNVPGEAKMGLGLTLARNFVFESGGRMNITSEKGKGTAVSMLIPLIKGENVSLSVGSAVPEILGGKFSPVEIVLSALCTK